MKVTYKKYKLSPETLRAIKRMMFIGSKTVNGESFIRCPESTGKFLMKIGAQLEEISSETIDHERVKLEAL